MKKISFLFVFVFALLISQNAFALQCKEGNYGVGDECWTDVQISSAETGLVIPGTVLEYDMATDSAQRNSWEVRIANASADYSRIAGVAQRNHATGDKATILVRGKGKVKVVNAAALATGDYLWASSTAGSFGPSVVTDGQASAFALQSNATATATIDAYIVVV